MAKRHYPNSRRNSPKFLISALIFGVALLAILGVKNSHTIGGLADSNGMSPHTSSCYDSDGGLNYQSSGQVTGYDASGHPYLYTDQCSPNRMTLSERYCEGVSPAVQRYSCPYGCANDKCNTAPTTTQCNDHIDNDGDGHYDYWSVSGNPDSKCSSTLDNDESPQDSCGDSDQGIDTRVQGTVSGDDEGIPYSRTDVCINADLVREYFCGNVGQDYAPLHIDISCRNQTNSTHSTCVSGRCA